MALKIYISRVEANAKNELNLLKDGNEVENEINYIKKPLLVYDIS